MPCASRRSRSTRSRSASSSARAARRFGALEADHEVQVDIEEDGTILIYATEGTQAEAAIAAIQAFDEVPDGDTYTGKWPKTRSTSAPSSS